MQSPHPTSPNPTRFTDSDTTIFRPRLRAPMTMHAGRRIPRAPIASIRPVAETSPIDSVQALAAAFFVVSMAACWITVASTVTAPLLAAGEMLGRVARSPEKQV